METYEGRVCGLTIYPHNRTHLKCEVELETPQGGKMRAVWLGFSHLPGVRIGTRMLLSGIPLRTSPQTLPHLEHGKDENEPCLMNPAYEIIALPQ